MCTHARTICAVHRTNYTCCLLWPRVWLTDVCGQLKCGKLTLHCSTSTWLLYRGNQGRARGKGFPLPGPLKLQYGPSVDLQCMLNDPPAYTPEWWIQKYCFCRTPPLVVYNSIKRSYLQPPMPSPGKNETNFQTYLYDCQFCLWAEHQPHLKIFTKYSGLPATAMSQNCNIRPSFSPSSS